MLSQDKLRSISRSVPWNLLLLTVGGTLYAFSMQSIAVHHEFVSGGVYGAAMLINYAAGAPSIAVIYVLLNIPILIVGRIFLSRRFMLYTLYGILVISAASRLIEFDLGVQDKTLAAIAAGILCGTGTGISMRSLGSDGGLSIIALALNHKYGLNIGVFNIACNLLVFAAATPIIGVDNMLYSMIITYMSAVLINYVLSMFNQRKLVFIISERHRDIAQSIMRNLGRGCTLLHGQGAFTRQEREVLMTVVHNMQVRRLEDIARQVDPQAFIIIENTNMVLGRGFSHRKQY
ncbi:MAG: YitT family protein [Desulfovibrio sp.]|nr:YitT family protein [Desulfovibrio sp.]